MTKEFVMQSGLDALMLIGLHPFKKTWFGYMRAFIFAFTFAIMYGLNIAGVVSRYTGIKSLANSVDSIPAGQQKLFKNMDNMWPDDIFGPELEENIKGKHAFFKKLFLIYRANIWITGTIYASKPLITMTRSFATAWYVPCDETLNSCYIPVVIGQTMYILYNSFAVTVFDVIFVCFLFHIFCEMEKVKYGLENLEIREDIEGDDPQVYRRFCDLVEHHQFLVNFTQDINDVYNLQLLNHFATMSATIVFGIFFMNMEGFPPTADKLYRYIPYLIAYHFQLYMYCISGEQLYNQLQSIGDILYESKWYLKHQQKLTNGILMVTGVSQIKNKLTIGNIWLLNLSTFMSVVKTSLSYHAFMQTICKAE